MHDVFISFSSRDVKVAEAAKHLLEARGIRCWKAPESIVTGQVWEEAITSAISTSTCMLLIWSSDSQNSKQVRRELTLAASKEKIIAPFRIEEIEPSGVFAYYLANTHWLDALNSDIHDGLERLGTQIKKLLGALPKEGSLEAVESSPLTPLAATNELKDEIEIAAEERREPSSSCNTVYKDSEAFTENHQADTQLELNGGQIELGVDLRSPPHKSIIRQRQLERSAPVHEKAGAIPIFANGLLPAGILFGLAIVVVSIIRPGELSYHVRAGNPLRMPNNTGISNNLLAKAIITNARTQCESEPNQNGGYEASITRYRSFIQKQAIDNEVTNSNTFQLLSNSLKEVMVKRWSCDEPNGDKAAEKVKEWLM